MSLVPIATCFVYIASIGPCFTWDLPSEGILSRQCSLRLNFYRAGGGEVLSLRWGFEQEREEEDWESE